MADLPSNTMAEIARLEVLEAYRSLPDDAHLRDLAGVATQLCNAPISVVNLVGEDELWSITAVGIEPIRIPKKNAFCDYTIRTDYELVIPDTHQDERFVAHPLVTQPPNVRFYAAAPLIVQGGFRIGTFCVVDGTPREPTAKLIENLRTLGHSVSQYLEYQVAQRSGLPPVAMLCAWCEKVQVADQAEWQTLPEYLREHASLTHGMCPSCLEAQA